MMKNGEGSIKTDASVLVSALVLFREVVIVTTRNKRSNFKQRFTENSRDILPEWIDSTLSEYQYVMTHKAKN